jgi:hypothetical protein
MFPDFLIKYTKIDFQKIEFNKLSNVSLFYDQKLIQLKIITNIKKCKNDD